MKHILQIAGILLMHSGIVFAQPPRISYLQVDEAQSHLWIVGSFGDTPGVVRIEDSVLGTVSWSDTLVVCNIRDSGMYSSGLVSVSNGTGQPDTRMLSAFHLYINSQQFAMTSPGIGFQNVGETVWGCSWRTDLSAATGPRSVIPFEISKVSSVRVDNFSDTCNWVDTSISVLKSFSCKGYVNVAQLRLERLEFTLHGNSLGKDRIYPPPVFQTLPFNADGAMKESHEDGEYLGIQKWDDLARLSIVHVPESLEAKTFSASQRVQVILTSNYGFSIDGGLINLPSASICEALSYSIYDLRGVAIDCGSCSVDEHSQIHISLSGGRRSPLFVVLQTSDRRLLGTTLMP
ncbi:MAG: hypothetical protein JSS75_03760 [Bacteroidetes bacterium]|nr:hypothetical protein [Bacteroidota bacterium]